MSRINESTLSCVVLICQLELAVKYINVFILTSATTLLMACGGSTPAVTCEGLPTTITQVWPTSERPVNVVVRAQFVAPVTATFDVYISGLHSLNSTNGVFGMLLYPTIKRDAGPAVTLSSEPPDVYTQSPGNTNTAFRVATQINAGQVTTLSIAGAAIGDPPSGVNMTTSSAYVSVCRAATSH